MSISIDGIIFSLQRHGGISVYFRELLKHLATRQEAVDLTLELPLIQSAPDSNATTLQREARRLERYRRARVSERASVFHSSYYRRPERKDLPTVVTVHDFIYERFRSGPARWVHVAQKHAAIRSAQAVICISESTRQDMLEWVGETPGQQVHVIHNGVSPDFRPLESGSRDAGGRPFALFVGERGGYKNFALALQALQLAPDLELHCVGGGAIRPEELAGIAAATAARVRHLGYVTDEALNASYNQAVCLLYPSRYEGFGIPVVEAMRAGCPVVCIDCAAILEIGGDALLVADPEPRALADAVLRLAEPDARSAVSMRGRIVAQRYDWAQTHQRTLDVYNQLGAARPTPA